MCDRIWRLKWILRTLQNQKHYIRGMYARLVLKLERCGYMAVARREKVLVHVRVALGMKLPKHSQMNMNG